MQRFITVFLISVMAGAQTPVGTIFPKAFGIKTQRGSTLVPVETSLDWGKPQPTITRAVVVFHGKGRDGMAYYRALEAAAERAGGAARETVLIAPQFLDQEDAVAHHLPSTMLRWRRTEWEGGSPAASPVPLSTFDVIDVMLQRLTDRSLFPHMKLIVLVGHSGGAQLLQRYAVVGQGAAAHDSGDIHIRYVVANPSSYLYFSDDRPAKTCPGFDHWKYGPVDPPAYVQFKPELEENYAKRDVVYLLGTADTDPHEKDLDTSCAGEAEGPNRFARGKAYFAYLHGRHSAEWRQRMWFVDGVGHSASKMINSTCGVAAIFDVGRCPDQ